MTARFKVATLTGPHDAGRPLRGQDVKVTVEGPDGAAMLVPAMSLVLKVGSRGELAVLQLEVPCVLVDIAGIPIDQVRLVGESVPSADVAAAMEESLGIRAGDTIAPPEAYAAERGQVERLPPRGPQSAWEAATAKPAASPAPVVPGAVNVADFLQPKPVINAPIGPTAPAGPDPMAELDAFIANSLRSQPTEPHDKYKDALPHDVRGWKPD